MSIIRLINIIQCVMYIIICLCFFLLYVSVLSDDYFGPHNQDDLNHPPAGMRTHQTPPPPGCLIPTRVHAVAQLWPVSVPDIFRDIAWKNPPQRILDFDHHYMLVGVQALKCLCKDMLMNIVWI
jgi:hypothetical protein